MTREGRAGQKLSDEDVRLILAAPEVHGMQTALAKHLGVSRARISQIRGKLPAATRPTVVAEPYRSLLPEVPPVRRSPAWRRDQSTKMQARWADPAWRERMRVRAAGRHPERTTGAWYIIRRSMGWTLIDPDGISRAVVYGQQTALRIAALLNTPEETAHADNATGDPSDAAGGAAAHAG